MTHLFLKCLKTEIFTKPKHVVKPLFFHLPCHFFVSPQFMALGESRISFPFFFFPLLIQISSKCSQAIFRLGHGINFKENCYRKEEGDPMDERDHKKEDRGNGKKKKKKLIQFYLVDISKRKGKVIIFGLFCWLHATAELTNGSRRIVEKAGRRIKVGLNRNTQQRQPKRPW